MKTLVIGIDGGDRRIIDALEMPRLQQLLEEQTCLDIEEDLWSRGWAEILCGHHAKDAGAFYSKPKLDGSYDFTQSFGVKDYENHEAITPLWKALNERGCAVGFMNVPTTGPAPEVEGFFVSGAGGGAGSSGVAKTPPAACYPKSILSELEALDYIFDTRFLASGIRQTDLLMQRLALMQTRRADAFLGLNETFQPDFGFIAYRGSAIVQYIAMSEIEVLIENREAPASKTQEQIAHVYKALDESIAHLLDTLQPEHVMVVSDHGAAPRRYTVNLNVFLQQAGLQKLRSSALRFAKRMAKKVLPSGSGASVRSALPASVGKVTRTDFDAARTHAFAARYVPGAYVNDRRRFGGPVSEAEVELVAQEVVEAFNASATAKEHDLRARPYRAVHADARCADLLPDVWIDHPDECFFEAQGAFVEPNADYGPLGASLAHVTRDQYTGIKGRYPLLCVDEAAAALVQDDDPTDLTLAYRLIDRLMAA